MFSHITSLSSAICIGSVLAIAPEIIPGFRIIWSDDFKSSTLREENWGYFTDPPYNNEQQTYAKEGNNCRLSSSHSLFIIPEKKDGHWTSCRLESKPHFEAKVGGQIIVQARLKFGQAGANLQGIWPAFWSLGEAIRHGVSWPACGEIDTVENVNGESLGYGTAHCNEIAWNSIAHEGMFIILNVAVGGDWPGKVVAETVSGEAASMEVQYVAVYESE
ncbi:related to endo-1,3-beta-glucanase [Rhynchosporium agropyri]|uniref:Related to endo-1,3-beta-glucanase n=1 Tax=Rhynchosporium agropyri TaxID=914238 RepID=A0A1E1K2Y5_9HELO|nr:related to endo-1,3-beta-glucanase [Rhynchosporium agropyri]